MTNQTPQRGPAVTATVTSDIKLLNSLMPAALRSANSLAKLAREMVMQIKEPADTLKDWGLSEADYAKLEAIPFYSRMIEAMRIEWAGALNTNQRIKIESAAIIEQNLLLIGARMQNPREALSAVIEAGKWLSKIAGLDAPVQGPQAGEKFVINIDLGADHQIKIERDLAPTNVEPPLLDLTAADGSAAEGGDEIPALPEGFSPELPVQPEPGALGSPDPLFANPEVPGEEPPL